MQDSIEDYIRISQNIKTEEPIKITNEILITAQVKQQYDAKAMQIVKFAIEGKLRPESLFKCLPHINQSHYQDIVEERAVTKLCGYPLCAQKIPDMPKKQYFISTKSNKVYDITDRKNFCSNHCYKSSVHIKNQVDSSPLWLRKHEEITKFTILGNTERGVPGEVVEQGIMKPKMENFFISVSSFAQISLDEAEENELKTQEEPEVSKRTLKKPKKYQKASMNTISENDEEQIELEAVKSSDKSEIEICPDSNNLHQAQQDENKIENCTRVASKEDKKDILKNRTHKGDLENQIKKCFKEWFSLETLIFLHGETIVRQKLDSQKLRDYFDSLKIADSQVERQKRYMAICRKLGLRELAEEKFDNAVIGHKTLKPIPDYKQLKEENRDVSLKVKSFYSGELCINENATIDIKANIEDHKEGSPAVLPLTDANSQNTLRRKIFLNSINRTMQVLLQTLKINSNTVLPELQSLVKSFNLKADNIVFKQTVWNYIAVVLLKILSLKIESIQSIFNEDRTKNILNLHNKEKCIEEIVYTVKDIDNFMKMYVTCE